ncbi:hypothetical protein BJV74DRAFT_798214 [Russula compacta]|nr:hypothetical protein BJV74DRAFT_798214 [Russula compacta]
MQSRAFAAAAEEGQHARARRLSTPERTHVDKTTFGITPGGPTTKRTLLALEALQMADNKAQEPRTVKAKRRTNWPPLETATELEPATWEHWKLRGGRAQRRTHKGALGGVARATNGHGQRIASHYHR